MDEGRLPKKIAKWQPEGPKRKVKSKLTRRKGFKVRWYKKDRQSKTGKKMETL